MDKFKKGDKVRIHLEGYYNIPATIRSKDNKNERIYWVTFESDTDAKRQFCFFHDHEMSLESSPDEIFRDLLK